jgi:hypothetical protein
MGNKMETTRVVQPKPKPETRWDIYVCPLSKDTPSSLLRRTERDRTAAGIEHGKRLRLRPGRQPDPGPPEVGSWCATYA